MKLRIDSVRWLLTLTMLTGLSCAEMKDKDEDQSIGYEADWSLTTTITCEDLAPHIIELSEENEGPSSVEILKMYDMKERPPRDYDLECTANALLSSGDDTPITFHMWTDKDGDQFVGYEADRDSTAIKTCEDLAPHIIELNEENDGPSSVKILKMYDMRERPSTKYDLECKANALLSRGDDIPVTFFIWTDKDGEKFIGLEPE